MKRLFLVLMLAIGCSDIVDSREEEFLETESEDFTDSESDSVTDSWSDSESEDSTEEVTDSESETQEVLTDSESLETDQSSEVEDTFTETDTGSFQDTESESIADTENTEETESEETTDTTICDFITCPEYPEIAGTVFRSSCLQSEFPEVTPNSIVHYSPDSGVCHVKDSGGYECKYTELIVPCEKLTQVCGQSFHQDPDYVFYFCVDPSQAR